MSALVRHPVCARLYARQVGHAEERGLRDRRRQLLAGLRGGVLEIGAGTGANLAHYPASVAHVVAVEPEPYLRRQLTQIAATTRVSASVLDAAGEDLPLESASFDAAVCSLVLCSVADAERVLAEVRRVLRPDGELRFLEHVASGHGWRRRLQRAADATVWPLVSGGCHLGRDTAQLIERAGFTVTDCERFEFHIPPLDPPKTHVLGRARVAALTEVDASRRVAA